MYVSNMVSGNVHLGATTTDSEGDNPEATKGDNLGATERYLDGDKGNPEVAENNSEGRRVTNQ